MKITDAKKACAWQMESLSSRKRELSKLLKEESGASQPQLDRVELSRELSEVESRYNQTSAVMAHLQQQETFRRDAEAAKQQGEAMAKSMEDMAKVMEIFRRIASGGRVPSADEKMLMDYSQEMYMMAKNMALINQQKERKEYDSLAEEESETAGDAASDAGGGETGEGPSIEAAASAPAAEGSGDPA